jgi:hypothetical protein
MKATKWSFALLACVLVASLGVSCGSHSNSAGSTDGGSTNDLFATTTRSGTVKLPSGTHIDVQTVTVQGTLAHVQPSTSGAFSMTAYASGPQLVVVLSPAGNPMLMGWLDATHTTVNAESTAEALVFYATGVPLMPMNAQEKALGAVASVPGLAGLTQAIAAALVTSADAFASANASVTSALDSVLAPFDLGPPGTIIKAQDLVIQPSAGSPQSGVSVLDSPPFAAYVRNAYRRRAWAFVQRVSETNVGADGTTTVHPDPADVASFEVWPVVGTNAGFSGTFSDIFDAWWGNQPSAGAPIDSPRDMVLAGTVMPFSTPLVSGSIKTSYAVTVVGPGVAFGPGLSGLTTPQSLEQAEVSVRGFVMDVLLPVIVNVFLGGSGSDSVNKQLQAAGLSISATDGTTSPAGAMWANVIKNVTSQILKSNNLVALVQAIQAGKWKNAFKTIIGDPASGSVVRGIVTDAISTYYLQEVADTFKDAWKAAEAKNLLKQFGNFMNGVGFGFQLVDLAAYAVSLEGSHAGDAWTIDVIGGKVRINPYPAEVPPSGMVGLAATVLSVGDAGGLAYTYLWSNTATAGTLTGPGSDAMTPLANGGSSYCSSKSTCTYVANSGPGDGGDQHDTVSVVVFDSPRCKGTQIGSATDLVTVTRGVKLAAVPATIGVGGSSTLTATMLGLPDAGAYTFDFKCPDCQAGKLEALGVMPSYDICSNGNQVNYTQMGDVTQDTTDTVTVDVYGAPACQGPILGSAAASVTVMVADGGAKDAGGDAGTCNGLTTTSVGTYQVVKAETPTEPRQQLPAPPDGSYVLTNATKYETPATPDAGEIVVQTESVQGLLTFSGTSMSLFYQLEGQPPIHSNYTISWVTGGPWVNIAPACISGGVDPMIYDGAGTYSPATQGQPIGYSTDGGLILGMEAVDPKTAFSGAGASPTSTIFTFAPQ